MEPRENLFFSMKKLCLSAEMLLGGMMKDNGLTASQGYLLFYIEREHPAGTSVTSLHKELGLSKAAISDGVKQLRRKGFVKTEISQADERQKKIIPTSKCGMIDEQLFRVISQTEDAICDGLDEGERELLCCLLQKMNGKQSSFQINEIKKG